MKVKWIIAVVFCIFLAVIVLPRLFVNRDLPQQLHGIWETDESRYEGRHFLMEENSIGFGDENGIVDWYEVTQVDQTAGRNNTVYTIEYRSIEGAVFKRSLTYNNSEDGPSIRFENQSDIEWFPVDS